MLEPMHDGGGGWLHVEELLLGRVKICLDISIGLVQDTDFCIGIASDTPLAVLMLVDVVLLEGSKLECDSGVGITLRDRLRFLLFNFSPGCFGTPVDRTKFQRFTSWLVLVYQATNC